MISKSTKVFYVVCILTGFFWSGMVNAQKIIWVSAGDGDSLGNVWDQGFVDLLVGQGYEVQREDSSMYTLEGETTLTNEQLDILESGDLVIVSRTNNSGNYNDAMGWNSIAKPVMLTSAYMSRANRWQWLDSSDLLGDGSYKATYFHVEAPEHPVFAGVELNEFGSVAVLDTSVGTGNTSLPNWMDWGEGTLLATVDETGTVAIVHWVKDAFFHGNTDQMATDQRMLFSCGTREPSGTDVPNALHGWGQENLTPAGETMFLNAVAFMLGEETGVASEPTQVPSQFGLQQNYPNPFNPSTTIEFSLSKSTDIKLGVYNMLGQQVSILAAGTTSAGAHKVTWDGLDASGNQVNSGVYFYKLQADGQTFTKKMLMIE